MTCRTPRLILDCWHTWTSSKRMEANAFLHTSVRHFSRVFALWIPLCPSTSLTDRVLSRRDTSQSVACPLRFSRRATLHERRVVVSNDREDATLLESRDCADSSRYFVDIVPSLQDVIIPDLGVDVLIFLLCLSAQVFIPSFFLHEDRKVFRIYFFNFIMYMTQFSKWIRYIVQWRMNIIQLIWVSSFVWQFSPSLQRIYHSIFIKFIGRRILVSISVFTPVIHARPSRS